MSHLRRQAIGPKNWLFVGNDDAASVNTDVQRYLGGHLYRRVTLGDIQPPGTA